MAEVRLEVDLAHPPERVWRALTTARLLGAWFMSTDLEPREGSRFTLDPGTLAGFLGLVSGELIEVVAGHRLVMVWQGEKLHTRVVWELVETGAGCRVQVVQTGFIGAPAALRRRALRDTYVRLFAEQLPALLERLATGPADLAASREPRSGAVPLPTGVTASGVSRPAPPLRAAAPPGDPSAGPVGVPRQRRPGGNVAVGAWSAGRTIGPPPPPTGDRAEAAREPTAGWPAGALPRQSSGTASVAAGGTSRPRPPPRSGWWEVVPAWARAVAIGVAAAALALAVLTAVSQAPPHGDAGLGGQPGGPDAAPGAPGVALQPGAVTSGTGPIGQPGSGASGSGQPGSGSGGPLPGGEPGAVTGHPGADGDPGEPGPVRASENTLTSGSPAPVLAARLTTSALPVLGGRTVAVMVANPGPGPARGWEVSMNVGDQAVTNVSGAVYQRDGTEATFTPEVAELPAGASAGFSFDLTAPVLGLLGGGDPTGCTVDGRPCD